MQGEKRLLQHSEESLTECFYLLPGLLKSREDGKQFIRCTGMHKDEIGTRKFCEDAYYCRKRRTKRNNFLERLLLQMKHERCAPIFKIVDGGDFNMIF